MILYRLESHWKIQHVATYESDTHFKSDHFVEDSYTGEDHQSMIVLHQNGKNKTVKTREHNKFSTFLIIDIFGIKVFV